MKKKLISLIVVLSVLIITGNVKAEEISKADVPNGSYIIGSHMFTREASGDYKGTLTVEYIMLASKTIDSTDIKDMTIYLKNSRGKWVNALTNAEISVPDTLEIDYKNAADLTPDIGEFIYGDVDGDGKVTGIDCTKLARALAGMTQITRRMEIVADLDQNGKLDNIDLDIFRRHIARWTGYDSLPIDLEKIIIYGDIYEDRKIDTRDLQAFATAIKNESIQIDTIKGIIADLNKDGTIDKTDLVILHKHLMGIEGYETLPVYDTKENTLYGDVNKDGKVNQDDAIAVFNYTMLPETYPLEDDAKVLADISLDGKVDYLDYDIFVKYVLKNETNYKNLPIANTEDIIVYGDINSDGIINYQDLQMLSRGVFEVSSLSGLGKKAADVYKDGVIDEKDLVLLHNYLSGFQSNTYNELGTNKYGPIAGADYKGNVFSDVDDNMNPIIDEKDVTAIRDYANGTKLLYGLDLLEADINLDGKVNEIDAILLSLHISGEVGFEHLYAIDLDKIIKYGDIDGNKTIDETDLNLISDYLENGTSLTTLQLLAADVNGDGKVSGFDYEILYGHLHGNEFFKELPYIK